MVRNRRISMKNAKELMLEYTAFSIREPKKAAEMFVLKEDSLGRCGVPRSQVHEFISH
jgi:hypothetical protein